MKKKLLSFILAICLIIPAMCYLSACGKEKEPTKPEEPVYSVGLEYELINNDEGYAVTGIGTCDDAHIKIPATYEGKMVVSIGERAFADKNIVSIQIPNGIKEIGSEAFKRCVNLRTITLPNSVEFIGEQVFYGSGLQRVELSPNLDIISQGAFSHCGNLTSVNIPDGVRIIDDGAFSVCKKLENVNIPQSVTVIGASAFWDCENVKLMNGLHNGVISIGNYAFSGTSLQNITIPNSVVELGEGVFSNCENLKGVNLPLSISEIKQSLFYNCINLEEISIPDSIIRIGDRAFTNCENLKSVKLGSGIKNIADDAFGNCYRLYEIINYSDLSLIIGERDNGRIAHYAKTIHENSSKYFYNNGYEFITGDNDVVYLTGYNGLESTQKLELSKLTYGNTTYSSYTIAKYAFYNCDNLNSIEVIEGFINIEEYAFYDCDNLEKVTVLSSMTISEGFPFLSCEKLTTVIIEEPEIANNIITKREYGDLFYNAQIIYIKTDLDVINSTYLLENFTKQATSDKAGYDMYVKNAE